MDTCISARLYCSPPAASSSLARKRQQESCCSFSLTVGSSSCWGKGAGEARGAAAALFNQRKVRIASSLAHSASRPPTGAQTEPLRVAGKSKHGLALKCRSQASDSESGLSKSKPPASLEIGTPVVIVEAPPFVKSADPMPMLRENKGHIKEGDVGR